MKNCLDEKLCQIQRQNNIAGMSVAVTDNKKILYSAGFGLDSTERPNVTATAESMYRIASITKVVTGFTIMKLCEDKILNLYEPISQYVPWLKLSNNAQDKISLFHLLSHTSGLPAEYNPDGPREECALEDSLKKELAETELAWSYDEGKFLYSNLGIRLASYIAEQKTGMRYSKLAKKYVLNPLSMNNTTFDLRVAATYALSLPHQQENGILRPNHYIKENAARLAAGGLYSNVFDLAKLARCILNSGLNDSQNAIIEKSTFEKMITPVAERGVNQNYCITLMADNYSGGTMIGHLGNAAPYGAGLFVDIKKGVGAIVLMNTFCSELRTEIPKILLEAFN